MIHNNPHRNGSFECREYRDEENPHTEVPEVCYKIYIITNGTSLSMDVACTPRSQKTYTHKTKS